jgi:hypothetical protein
MPSDKVDALDKAILVEPEYSTVVATRRLRQAAPIIRIPPKHDAARPFREDREKSGFR